MRLLDLMAKSKKKPAKVRTKKPSPRKPTSRTTAKAKRLAKKGPSRKSKAARPRPKKAQAPKARGLPIKALGGHVCELVLDEDCAQDPERGDIDWAIASFIALEPSVLRDVEEHVFRYYLDCKGDFEPGEPGYLEIGRASDVWKHVEFGEEATVGREGKAVYISLGCNCDWEEEHGLQIVFKDGQRVNKVGPFNGHFTNVHAYDDPSLENVIYRPRARA
jgi:hypothetical protein